ncbi:hypothetical protein CCMA1212_003802 [Trichoderma ghanense]|uniref:Uncharacterized protein n=1 Tax=Trichoderma ghanense TaxID=65468 RepID=A0ABY2H940_9HYPO
MRVASMDGQEESTALSVTTTRGCSTCQVRGPVVTSYWNAATYTSKDEVEASVCELSPHAQHQPPEIRLTKLYKRWRQGNVRARQISPHSRVLVVDFMLRGRGGYPFMKPNWEIDEQNAAQLKAILELLCLSNTMLSKKTRTPTDGEAAHKDTKHPKGKAGGKKGPMLYGLARAIPPDSSKGMPDRAQETGDAANTGAQPDGPGRERAQADRSHSPNVQPQHSQTQQYKHPYGHTTYLDGMECRLGQRARRLDGSGAMRYAPSLSLAPPPQKGRIRPTQARVLGAARTRLGDIANGRHRQDTT